MLIDISMFDYLYLKPSILSAVANITCRYHVNATSNTGTVYSGYHRFGTLVKFKRNVLLLETTQ